MSESALPPAIDPESLANLRLIGGGTNEFIAEIAQMFREDTPPRFAEINQCLARGEAPTIGKLAHGLKGAASNFGSQRFRAVAEELEHLAKAGNLAPAPALLTQLQDEYGRILAALDETLKVS
jgi:hypothetical protein